jgi:hypothetical protein
MGTRATSPRSGAGQDLSLKRLTHEEGSLEMLIGAAMPWSSGLMCKESMTRRWLDLLCR